MVLQDFAQIAMLNTKDINIIFVLIVRRQKKQKRKNLLHMYTLIFHLVLKMKLKHMGLYGIMNINYGEPTKNINQT